MQVRGPDNTVSLYGNVAPFLRESSYAHRSQSASLWSEPGHTPGYQLDGWADPCQLKWNSSLLSTLVKCPVSFQ